MLWPWQADLWLRNEFSIAWISGSLCSASLTSCTALLSTSSYSFLRSRPEWESEISSRSWCLLEKFGSIFTQLLGAEMGLFSLSVSEVRVTNTEMKISNCPSCLLSRMKITNFEFRASCPYCWEKRISSCAATSLPLYLPDHQSAAHLYTQAHLCLCRHIRHLQLHLQ